MKILFDTEAVIDATIGADEYPHSFNLLNQLIDDPDLSLWISAISIININNIVSKLYGKEKVEELFNLIKEEFSIIPFSRKFQPVLFYGMIRLLKEV